MNVSAKDKSSGKEQKVRIEQSGGLSDDEIQRMRKDAESHASDDENRRKLAEARNNGNRLIYDTEKLLTEHADKLDEGSKLAIQASVEKVRTAVGGEDVEAITNAVNELQQASAAFARAYEQAAAGAADPSQPDADAGASASGGDDDVIDAEFEKKE